MCELRIFIVVNAQQSYYLARDWRYCQQVHHYCTVNVKLAVCCRGPLVAITLTVDVVVCVAACEELHRQRKGWRPHGAGVKHLRADGGVRAHNSYEKCSKSSAVFRRGSIWQPRFSQPLTPR